MKYLKKWRSKTKKIVLICYTKSTKYYVWYKAEIDEILGANSEAFCKDYQVTEYGNWEHGVNILWKNYTTLISKYY